jgi:hypothetical protein
LRCDEKVSGRERERKREEGEWESGMWGGEIERERKHDGCNEIGGKDGELVATQKERECATCGSGEE